MDCRLFIFAVTLIAALSHVVHSEPIEKERQRRALWQAPGLFNLEDQEESAENKRADTVNLDTNQDFDKKHLQELEKDALEKSDDMKRGVFDCVNRRKRCTWFKHCCGDLECSRTGVEYSGVCEINLKKRAENVNLNTIQDFDKKDLQDLGKDALEKSDDMKRGVFDCVNLGKKCTWFKHCCGDLECSRTGVGYSGVCEINLKKRAETVNLNTIQDFDKKDLQDLGKDVLEKSDDMKRGVFDCVNLGKKCTWFKHCCGDLECSRTGVGYSGVCEINLKKRAETVNLDTIQDFDKKDLQELEKDALEKSDDMKRGVFDCVNLFARCTWFKHCCGDLECSRTGVEYSGVCVINV